MKKYILVVAIIVFNITIGWTQFSFQNVTLMSNWFDSGVLPEPTYGIKYQGVWGWTGPLGKQYAIIGSTAGTYIIEVTNSASPVLRAYIPGRRSQCIWREYKTYNNYLYMVSDDSSPNSLQIADLSYLPDSVKIVHDSDTIFRQAHTIFIEGNKLYCASVKSPTTGYSPMSVYNLSNPAKPQLIRSLSQDYPGLVGHVHDMFVRNDTIYASCGNDGFYIFKFMPNNTFSLLNSILVYPDKGYNHSSVLSDDSKTLVFVDEVPDGMAVKVYDISDIMNPQLKSTFKSNPGATPHNPYMIGNKLVIAYYQDGVQIFDLTNPSSPTRIGFFDTYPQNGAVYTNPAYAGCWGAYVEFGNGKLLASDMQNGLFVLDHSLAVGMISNPTSGDAPNAFPNPFSEKIHCDLNDFQEGSVKYTLSDLTGRSILTGQFNGNSNGEETLINTQTVIPGSYVLSLSSSQFCKHLKLIKQ
jgi:choice-of-anchor B domain-containing protein